MTEVLKPDLCVIGAGSGGLSVASAAAQLGLKVVLIEKGEMGGDCLNSGCVPSKSLIAAAKRAHLMRTTRPFGITPTSPVVNHRAVNAHVQGVIAAIAPNDSVERFTGLGVRVIRAPAGFADAATVVAGDTAVRARRFVVATGSSPAIPPIPGLDAVAYFTNETIFRNIDKLDHLIVIGGGPIGLELAQAHLRLGSKVTVLEAMKALGKDDDELVAPLLKALREEGLVIREGAQVERIEPREGGGIRVRVLAGGEALAVEGTHLLVATGRKPNLEGLDLDAAGIKFDRRGIKVDSGLRTTNRRVYAIGDVAGSLQFTHVANYHAGIVIRRAVFRVPAKVNEGLVPWVTFTDPELAQVGLSEDAARKRYGQRISVLRWPFAENDRAQAERRTEGFVKVVMLPSGRILGATMLAEHAGELIQTWGLAVSSRLGIKAMADTIVPYPTLSEVNKRAAQTFFLPKLAHPTVRRIARFLTQLG